MAYKLTAEIPLENIERIQLYINSRKKSLATVRAETGADYALNGGLYDTTTYIPCVATKADGIIYGTAPWQEQGYGWKTDDPALMTLPAGTRNYLAGNLLVEAGKPVAKLHYDSAQGGRRGRSAMGTKGRALCLYCSKDGYSVAATPETLRDELAGLGWTDAIMLDSGGSSQCDFSGDRIVSSRPVQNLILVFLKRTECPYREPTALVRYGSRGEGARWVQWQLNRHGATLTVDGIFGMISLTALRRFQNKNGLTVDGICGPLTREKLKR